MAPILKAVLPRSGIVRTFPRDVLYAPLSLAGMGLMHPYHRQYMRHIELILKESLRPSITNNLLNATLKQLSLESGLPQQHYDWELDHTNSYLTNCWLKDLLTFCHDEGISLHNTAPKLTPNSTNDQFLMESFIQEGFSPKSLRTLNECRMFLWVITRSDISTADLAYITHDAYNGSTVSRIRQAEWPRRPPKLPLSHWSTWKKALSKCYLQNGTTNRRLRITR